MNFDFSSTQKQLREAARRFLEARSPAREVRRVLDGEHPFHSELWSELATMGFTGAAISEEYGGSGQGYLELCIIAEELGRVVAAVPFSSSVYLFAEFIKRAGTDAQKKAWLPRVASADVIGALAWSEGSGQVTARKIAAEVDNKQLTGRKVPVLDGHIAHVAVVVARDREADGALSLFLVDLHDPRVTRSPLQTIDPARGQAALRFDAVTAERLGNAGEGEAILADVLDRAAVLLAFEQVGGSDKALEMARDYSLQRFAFGRPIGSFQALKHMMADMYVASTLARSNAYYGAWALSTAAGELPVAAAYARVSSTQAYLHCAKNNIQVHGGMGFTWEADCHLHYRRANLHALSLGSLSEWEDKLIVRLTAQIRAGHAAPEGH